MSQKEQAIIAKTLEILSEITEVPEEPDKDKGMKRTVEFVVRCANSPEQLEKEHVRDCVKMLYLSEPNAGEPVRSYWRTSE